jgi:nucleotide-binding universal stress UspA family protein
MIRDIVVNLNVGAKASPASDFAISVAAAFNAHLTGIAFLYDPVVPVSSVGLLPAEVIVTQQDYQAAVRAARERFAAASESAGVTAEPLTLSASVVGVGDQFGKIARRFDLAVVDQAESETNAVQGVIVEAALFDSGRPVICVPFIQKEPLKLDRVMVCWDGGRAAARAIGDAMPFLQRAGRVEVVMVTKERGKQDQIEGSDIGAHLARHGLNVEVKHIPIGDIDVAAMLLSLAADAGIDFIVMGGYGHSRLREFVLGGVTRSILQSMTVPVLMSH